MSFDQEYQCDSCAFNPYCDNLETIQNKCAYYTGFDNDFIRMILINAHDAGFEEGYREAIELCEQAANEESELRGEE